MDPTTETATLLLAGDLMTGRGIDQALAHPGSPQLHEPQVHDARDYLRLAERRHGPVARPLTARQLWGAALQEIKAMQPEAHIVNLETAITAGGAPWPGKGIHYRMHPDNIACLKVAGIDVCTLANNHVLDWGRDGLDDTLATLHKARLRCAGAGADLMQALAPAVVPLPGGRRLLVHACAAPDCGVPPAWAAGSGRAGVALLPDLGEAGLRQLGDAIRRHRREGDLVLLSIHWGANRVDAVPAEHRRFARELVDRDLVDLVQGHSAHHPLPFELHRGKLILYGCGDLINDYEGIDAHPDLAQDAACLYFATVSQDSGRLARLKLVPMQRRRFGLVPADPSTRAAIRHALRLKENGFARLLLWRPDGHWVIEPPAGALAARGGR